MAQASIYALLKADRVKRVDLHTLSGVVSALRVLTGKNVHVGDLLEETTDQAEHEDLAQLLSGCRPVPWDAFNSRAASFTADELQKDVGYWEEQRREHPEQLRREQLP